MTVRRDVNYMAGLEQILVVFIIIIFSISAFQSSYIIYEEMQEEYEGFSEEKNNKVVLAEIRNFYDIFVFYLIGKQGFSKTEAINSLNYLTDILKNVIYPKIRHKSEGQKAIRAFENDFIKMQEFLGGLNAPENRQINEGIVLLNALNVSLDNLTRLADREKQIEYKRDLDNTQMFLLFSILCMVISGLGLIFLFMLKLRVLEQNSIERKKMLALLASRVTAMEAASDGIGIVDRDGNLTYINKALMSLHGIIPQDLDKYIGKPWEYLYSEKGQLILKEKVLPLLAKEGFWKGESPILKKDGTIADAEMSLTLLEDGSFIGTARDITERKKAEREKEDLQSQFFQAQKMEAIGRLAGGIAHDFNNILAAMLGYTEFLLEDLPDDSKEHHFVSQILNGAMQAQKLVEQILTFSRRGEPINEVIDLVEAVNDTAAMLKATVPSAIKLQTVVDINEAFINGSSTQISQTLMNLCVNAIDAIDEKNGTLSLHVGIVESDQAVRKEMLVEETISAEDAALVRIWEEEGGQSYLELGRLVRGKKYVRLQVTDSGCGMSKNIMEHIFEPFFTTKPVDQGTGLGLSSVHDIVAAHGGAIIVESQVDRGTGFLLFFPLVEKIETFDTAIEGFPETVRGNILLVEDEMHVRVMMEQMLKRMGYDVHCCCDGDEAVDHIRQNRGHYDLVISDYTMPNMNGGAMAREIVSDFPDLPIIIVSGYSNRRLKTISIENPNIKAVLRKPLRREALAKQIHMVLHGQKQAA